MRGRLRASLVLVAMVCAAPAQAGWKFVSALSDIKVGELNASPSLNWNQASTKPGPHGVSWTQDGLDLNAFEMFSAISAGEPLYRERDRKNNPMPHFDAGMLLPDLGDFFERSFRVSQGLTDFAIEKTSPVAFLSQRGLEVRYRYSLLNDDLPRQGMARLVIIGGKLYAANFLAPQLHYFAAGLPEADSIMSKLKR